MEYIKKAEQTIRNSWFDKHTAEITGEEGFQVIHWKEKGTFMYHTKFVLSGNNVFVSGDIGEAVYTLTCRATLENIKDFNLHYFTEKLQALHRDRWDFDTSLAKKELKQYWKEYELKEKYAESNEVYEEIVSAIDESNSLESYRAWLLHVYQNGILDSDDIEEIWNFGKRLPYCLIGYWVGLQMAIDQLTKEKAEA